MADARRPTPIYPQSHDDVLRQAGESDAKVGVLLDWRGGRQGAVPLGDAVYAITGLTPLQARKGPPGARGVCIRVEVGTWTVRAGDQDFRRFTYAAADNTLVEWLLGPHNFISGDGPVHVDDAGSPQLLDRLFYVSRVSSLKIRLHSTQHDARRGTLPVDLSPHILNADELSLQGNTLAPTVTDTAVGDSPATMAAVSEAVWFGRDFTARNFPTNPAARLLYWWLA